MDETVRKVMAEANAAFAKMGQLVEEAVRSCAVALNLVEAARPRVIDEVPFFRGMSSKTARTCAASQLVFIRYKQR